MIHRKKWFTGLLGVMALGMVFASSAWACTGGLFTDADMQLSPNFSECLPTVYPACGTSVDVEGSNFENHDGDPVGTVTLWWLDEPFFFGGLGGPGDVGQQADGELCSTKGVKLTDDPVDVSATGTFTTSVTVPPGADEYADETPRLITAYYGANAICATWSHDGHTAGVGNQFTLYPA